LQRLELSGLRGKITGFKRSDWKINFLQAIDQNKHLISVMTTVTWNF